MRRPAGDSWVEQGLMFCTRQGSALDAANVQRSFRPSRERDRLHRLVRLEQRQLIGVLGEEVCGLQEQRRRSAGMRQPQSIFGF
jgi:hypothetical protein